MAYEAVRAGLRGVATGLLTPFDEDLEIDHTALAENAHALYDRGFRTFLAAANISEYHSLSRSERVDSVETSTETLPDDTTVLAGVGGSTKDARELIEAYDGIAVDAMMIMPPNHSYLHERGLLRYYESLAEATDRPLVPYVRGYDPSISFLESLTHLDCIAGIKYAITDVQKLSNAVEAGSDDVVWVNGLAEPFAPDCHIAGAEGFSAGVSNFIPEIGLELFEALESEKYQRAVTLRNITLPYMNFRNTTGEDNTFPSANSVPAVKKGLELAGFNGGPVREPIVGLSRSDEEKAEQLYTRLQNDADDLLD